MSPPEAWKTFAETNGRCPPHTVRLQRLQRLQRLGLNPWKNINGNKRLHQHGMDVSFPFTWEPNLWLNSEVEITENMKAQLSV